MIKKAFGPPGTGKTTWIVNQTAELVRSGEVNPYNIVSTSLTRATKQALLNKLNSIGVEINPEQIRTLHSWCYQSLSSDGYKPVVVKNKELKAFFDWVGFEFKAENDSSGDEEYTAADYNDAEGNKLYQMFTKLRLTWNGGDRREHVYAFYEREKDEMPVSDRTFYNLFVEYLSWLDKEGVYDFTKLLTEAYKRGVSLGGDLLILDEFQDKGNLHVLLVKAWLKNFKHVLVCGDDDQAIFTFAGSNPRHLIELESDETHILPTSYRLPSRIHSLAMRIIRENRYRVLKEFKPAKDGGDIDLLYSRDEVIGSLNGKRSYILARNRYFVQEWKDTLESQDIPYRIIGNKARVPKLAHNVRTHLKLLEGKHVGDEELTALIRELKPLVKEKTGKKQVRETVVNTIVQKVKKRDFTDTEGKIAYLILHSGPERLFTSEDEVAVKKWKRRAESLEKWANPNIHIGTIHSAKGLEADTVFLDTRITKRVFEEALKDPETERRVLYVGVTRAKENLKLISLRGAYSYEHLGML